MKPMRIYKVGWRTAINYNEWMKYIHNNCKRKSLYFKQINKKK